MAKKVLIIDDEVEFTDAVRTRLEAGGYDILAAYDGKSGLESAKKNNPDIILLDLVMPDIDGLTVLSELNRNPYTFSIPVVVLSAKTEKEYVLDAGSLGAAAYLAKPIKMSELEDTLKKFLHE